MLRPGLEIGLVALLALAAPVLGREDQGEDPVAVALARLRVEAASEDLDAVQLAGELQEGGSEVVPLLFAVFDTGVLPPPEDAPEEGPRAVPPGVRRALLATFPRLPLRAVRDHLRALAELPWNGRTRANALHVLGGLGGGRDLELLHVLASHGAPELVGEKVRAAYEAALKLVFERDPDAPRWTGDAYALASPRLRVAMIDALSSSEAPDRLSTLASLLEVVPESDVAVLRAISSAAARGRAHPDEFVLGATRARLDAADATTRRAAAEAAGFLEDEDAIPKLLALMTSDDLVDRSVARSALRRIAVHDHGADPQRWQAWYEDEKRWWREHSRDTLAALRKSDPAAVCAAIADLTHRSLYRDELSNALAEVLGRPEPQLRRLAAVALGHLGVRQTRSALLPLLDDPDPETRAAVREAVVRLSTRAMSR